MTLRKMSCEENNFKSLYCRLCWQNLEGVNVNKMKEIFLKRKHE